MDTPASASSKKISFAEFVVIQALAMSLVALSIDTVLPALPHIGESFGVGRVNDQQFMITVLFIGLSIGQLLAGPLSDSFGRKNALYGGLVVFVIGALISYFATSYEMMLAGRFIQGFGAAAPRIVTVAMVRDRYVGRDMARVMSYIMGVFILVPIIAPAVGLGVMVIADWHAIFLMLVAMGALVFVWGGLRLDETIAREDKRPFTLPVIADGVRSVCTNRMSICYTVASGLAFGALMGYINTAQQIFQGYYDTGNMFALYFGLGALSLGVSFFVNAHFVRRVGMRFVVLRSMIILAAASAAFIGYELVFHGQVPLPVFMLFMMVSSFCMGLCFGNLNALAMVPMGHMAGIASSMIGAISLVVAIVMGSTIGQMYTGDLFPLSIGFLVAAILSLGMMILAEPKGIGTTPV